MKQVDMGGAQRVLPVADAASAWKSNRRLQVKQERLLKPFPTLTPYCTQDNRQETFSRGHRVLNKTLSMSANCFGGLLGVELQRISVRSWITRFKYAGAI